MKRYRVLPGDLDTRAYILDLHIEDAWDPTAKSALLANKEAIVAELLTQYGPAGGRRKIEDFRALGSAPLSIVAFHNKFLWQIRHAFTIGAYYPALTGACALGERILNHLVLTMRPFYKATPQYAKVHKKNSFDDWSTAIDTLEAWGVFRTEVTQQYKVLRDARHKAIHFRPDTDSNDREEALRAIRLLSELIGLQFGAVGPLPWFIPTTLGAVFIKKEWNDHPFIRQIYLPNCVLVGPHHRIDGVDAGGWTVVDRDDYDEREVTDDEFAKLYNDR